MFDSNLSWGLLTALWLVVGVCALFPAVMSPMMFDAPGSTSNPFTVGAAVSFAALPFSINSTRRRRPSGVSGALRCTRASLGIAKPSDSSTLAQGAQPSADVTNVPNYNS